MSYALGLDFGTTFTAAAVEQDGVVRVATLGNRAGAVPAAVFIREDGSLLHGEAAFMRGASEPLRLVRNLKRRLGESATIEVEGARYESVRLVADHLRWAVNRVADLEGGMPDRLVLSHPASWRSTRLNGMRQAIELAGLDPELITEPHAAAMFHAEHHPLAVGDLVAAYDLGGGTFDAAVLRRTRRGFDLAGEPEGEDHLGGIDFDDVVFHLVQARLGDQWQEASRTGGRAFEVAVAGVRRECVTAKETLSSEESVEVPVLLPGIMVPVPVTRRDFEHLIRPAVDESIGSFRRAVTGAGATVDGLSAVLLVGGSCRLPIVRSSLEQAVGEGVMLLDADPKHAVARGAALVAGELATGTVAPVAPVAAPSLTAAIAPPLTPAAPAVQAAAETVPPAGAPPPSPEHPAPTPADEESSRLAPPVLAALAVAALLLVLLPIGYLLTRDDGDQLGAEGEPSGEDATADDATSGEGDGSGDADGGADGDDEATVVGASSDEPAASADNMVEIPAGTYDLGAEVADSESVEAFSQAVESFHVDVFEVSNEQYLAFVQQIGAPAPLSWDRGVMPEALADHPVTGVEYVWGEAYCVALGKRLPSDAEWEVAARGPAGTLYPAGDTPDGLDLEEPGTRPVGSTPANVSGFGVHDTVGSVWEWVAEPYAPIDDSNRVRRGGQYGRVRGGAAMRQEVDPTGQATISETGFRCAADLVDPAVSPLQFDVSHERPEVEDAAGGPQAASPTDGVTLVSDSFDNTESGFADVEEDTWRIGYHAPSWYHLEATEPNAQIVSLGGYNLADGEIELTVYIDKLETDAGQFRYGLIFRSEGAVEEPPVGILGPARPEVYYAFVINPRAGVWELLHQDELPQRVQATGPLPTVAVTDPDAPDVLGLSMDGAAVSLFVNGEQVGVFDTRGYHVGAGNLGLYAETFDETLVHAHFDLLTVTQG